MGSMRAAPLLCVTLLTLLLDAVYAGAGVRLLVVGDWGRQGSSDQRKVADAMGREAASAPLYAVLSTGGALLSTSFRMLPRHPLMAAWMTMAVWARADNFYERGLSNPRDGGFFSSFQNVRGTHLPPTSWCFTPERAWGDEWRARLGVRRCTRAPR